MTVLLKVVDYVETISEILENEINTGEIIINVKLDNIVVISS